MTIPAKVPDDVIERTLIQGDLSKLTPQERTVYYQRVCQSLGLNPLTQPFEYLVLNGKLRLYARRDCADQLRKIHGISIKIVSQDLSEGICTIHVSARDGSGREDEDLGVVAIPENLRGEARANSIMKAITKAKRRVTLSISGLGMLDENEVEDIPGARPAPRAAANVMKAVEPPHDELGEILDEPDSTSRPASLDDQVASPQPSGSQAAEAPASAIGAGADIDDFKQVDHRLHAAALRGLESLQEEWMKLTQTQRKAHKQALDRRHKATAEAADAEAENERAARDDAI